MRMIGINVPRPTLIHPIAFTTAPAMARSALRPGEKREWITITARNDTDRLPTQTSKLSTSVTTTTRLPRPTHPVIPGRNFLLCISTDLHVIHSTKDIELFYDDTGMTDVICGEMCMNYPFMGTTNGKLSTASLVCSEGTRS